MTSFHFTSLPSTSLHFTSPRFISLPHFTLLHFTLLHFTSLHFTSLHFTSLHFTLLYITSLHFTFLFFYPLHFISLYFTSFQVKHSREDLITHPLVVYLLDSKWRMFGRKIFYMKMSLYAFFLLFLTGYIILATQNSPEPGVVNHITSDNKTVNVSTCINKEYEDTLNFRVFIELGRYILLIAACLHLLFEVSVVFKKIKSFSTRKRSS